MKKSRKRKIIIALLAVLALVVLVHVGWYGWRLVKYGAYSKGMDKNPYATWMVPRYMHTDRDGFDYGVKYPDYISFTGNMSVGLPTTPDNYFTDCLIIWPKFFGGYEYGVILYTEEEEFQIYVNADGSAVDKKDSEIAERHKETIDTLFRKANEMWDLD